MTKVKKPSIEYTSREFVTIRRSLLEYTKKYYPDSYQDFNEAGFGSLVLDTVSYVGDMLSFYMDYQINESFLQTASETNNVIKLAKQLGYRHQGPAAAHGVASFYIFVPATINGNAPDRNYIPVLKKNSTFSSTDGVQFILLEDVHFDGENSEVVIGKIDPDTGLPLLYAIKSYGNVVSGRDIQLTIPVGEFQNFLKVQIPQQNIIEVLSVTDGDGFEYYEVEHLAQDHVYRAVSNRTSTKRQVNNLLRPYYVPRRFVVERTDDQTYLQFGFGVDENKDENYRIADPSDIVLRKTSKLYTSNTSFDPSRLIKTDKFGIAPQNTSLSVVVRIADDTSTSIAANTLTEVTNAIMEFDDLNSLQLDGISIVNSSIQVNNEEKIIGDTRTLNPQEIKTLALSNYSSQNRAVTKEDYKSLIYGMPNKYGSVKRINVIRDADSYRRNLNVYVLCEDENSKLTNATQTLKENLKIWINQNKMINDTVDILDGKVLNLGINFSIIVDQMNNSDEVLADCLSELKGFYRQLAPEMGESFFITDVYKQLRNVSGVLDVSHVHVFSKNGGNYSNISLDIEKLKSSDGRYLEIPDNVVYEIKFLDNDIKGVVV